MDVVVFLLLFKTLQRKHTTLVTFDLIVEGHRGIGDAFPSDTVENSARHREAHDTEDGLHAKQQKHHYMSKCGALYKTFSYLQHKENIFNLNFKKN